MNIETTNPETLTTELFAETPSIAHALITQELTEMEAATQKVLCDFQTKIAESPDALPYVIRWDATKVMTAHHLRDLVREVIYAIGEGHDAAKTLDEAAARATRQLVEYEPWKHNSTGMIENAENQCKAEAYSQFIKKVRWIQAKVDFAVRQERVLALQKDYHLLPELQEMTLNEVATAFGIDKPRSNAAKSDIETKKRHLRGFLISRALDHDVRFTTIKQAANVKEAVESLPGS